MSIKLMSAIFATKFTDLKDGAGYVTKASTAKQVLLALADHANDDGEGAYPGLTRMELKTDLSRQTIVSVYRVLVYNGIITLTGRSKFRTHNYSINPNAFPGTYEKPARLVTGRAGELVKPLDESSTLTDDGQAALPVKPIDESSPLTDDGQATSPVKPTDESSPLTDDGQAASPLMVKPPDLNHPLTTIKPSREIDSGDFAKIWTELEQLCGAVSSDTTRLIEVWIEKHPLERIHQAISLARDKRAGSPKYVDQVLITWEANGYPPTREEQVLARAFKPAANKGAERVNSALSALINYQKVLEANGE